ncbi:hypothetical protein tb265_18890 [Gemmatimonadetes bacterium T265]|nr:hypothetical protein tb265_18890 [Gemmatimonadetes bacterium T265]
MSKPPRRLRARVARARAAVTLGTLSAALAAACGRSAPAPAAAPAPAPASGPSLLEAMRARYAGRWYRTLTFTQRTTLVGRDGRERHEVWAEALEVPGRLRIDRDSTLRSGTLFANDSQYVVRDGRVIAGVAGYNPLLVLGFDVYGQPASRTEAALRTLGFPSRPVREDRWEGRPVWVVGGAPGDLHSPQYWIDQERLVFVRLLEPTAGDTTKTTDFRFGDYRAMGGGWVAARVEGYTGGTRTLLEEYDGLRTDVALDPALFDARRWTTARHWKR